MINHNTVNVTEEQNRNNLLNMTVMLFPILMMLTPSPSFLDAQYLTTPLNTFIFITVILIFRERSFIPKNFNIIFVILAGYFVSIFSSLIFGQYSMSGLIQAGKPLYFAVVFVFSLFIAKSVRYDNIVKYVLKAIYIILCVQIITCVFQLLNIHLLDFLYSSENSSPLGGITRVVGTMRNPNTLGWFLIQLAVIIFALEKNAFRKYFSLLVITVLLFYAGSRASLLLFFAAFLLMSFITLFAHGKINLKVILKYVCVLIVAYIILIIFLEMFGSHFPYMRQLLSVLKGESIMSINSLAERSRIWSSAIEIFTEDLTLKRVIFGLGARSIAVVDNAYLYSFFNTGILGLLFTLMLYVIPLVIVVKSPKNDFSFILIQYVVLSFITSIQSDNFAAWDFAPLLMFYLALSSINNKEFKTGVNQSKQN